MARNGAVAHHPRYHAQEKHLRFGDVAFHLCFCFRVKPDFRRRGDGSARHPGAWMAWTPWRREHHLRVDFELAQTHRGATIMVVTAMEVVAPGGGR